MEKMEEDRISALPDCLLVEILSRVPSIKYAIRTGTLSKRWRYLWTWVHTLMFKHTDRKSLSAFASFMDKTLTQCRRLKLKKFKFYIFYHIPLVSQFNEWIRYAISCNVEELDFMLWCKADIRFPLDQIVFTSSCLTHLKLAGFVFNPTGAIRWKNLRSLWISCAKLDEDLVKNILCGSPLLETFVLDHCYGYRVLNITSKSIKEVVISGYYNFEDKYDDDIIEINAPNILSLKIQGLLWLWKVLLLNVSSVVEANLSCEGFGYSRRREELEEETLKGYILNLTHVKVLKVGVKCTRVLSRLEAKGFVLPSSIKFICHWYDGDSHSVKSGGREVLSLINGPSGNMVD